MARGGIEGDPRGADDIVRAAEEAELITTATRRHGAPTVTPAAVNELATRIVDGCFRIHRELGPGLLESTYQACLTHELRRDGLRVDTEVVLPIRYRDIRIDAGYRVDMVVEEMIIVENKAVRELLPVHYAQLLTYLKLSDVPLGYLINWNVPLLKLGIRRIAHRM